MQLTASVLQTTGEMHGGVGTEKLIGAIRKHLSDAAWIGVTDQSGAVLAGDFGRLEGASLATQDWFMAAKQGAYVHGPEQFPELAKLLAPNEGGQSRNFLLILAPIVSDGNTTVGYMVTCFDMDWIEEIQRLAGESLAGTRPIDIFVLNDGGTPVNWLLDGIAPPEKDLSDRIRTAATEIPQGPGQGFLTTDNYLIGFARTRELKISGETPGPSSSVKRSPRPTCPPITQPWPLRFRAWFWDLVSLSQPHLEQNIFCAA